MWLFMVIAYARNILLMVIELANISTYLIKYIITLSSLYTVREANRHD